MKIAICDDTLEELNNTKALLVEYFKSRKLNVQIDTYNSANVLLNKIIYFNRNEYDFFFLDIIMPVNGINLAKKIKELNEKAIIIFTTTSKEYAIDAFSVRANSYFLKPLNKNEVYERLDYELKAYTNKMKSSFSFKTDKFSTITININEIAYIEANNRRLEIHMYDNQVYSSPSLRTKFLESIPFEYEKYNFINCHSSYLVNMDYIKSINSLTFTMENKDIIPISKRNYSMAKDKYFKYLTGEQYDS